MNSNSKMGLTLRTRLLASVALMIIPAAVLLISAFGALEDSVGIVENIVDDASEEVRFTQKLKTQMIQTELPFAQYLSRGETGDRETFIRMSVEIDRAYENASNSLHLSAHQMDMLKLARAEWLGAKALGEKLLTKNEIPGLDELSARIDEFSRHLSRAIAVLDDITQSAYMEIRELRHAAQDNEWKAMSILLMIFGLGVMLAIFEALALQHAVLDPLNRLEKSITQYAKGDLTTRVSVKSNDEIGHLASAFNLMAERFSNVQNELDYLSIHDSLTGLYDRTKFHEEINVEIQRAKRHKREFSILLLDIRGFRKVNEAYGRLVGDSVLCSVATQISTTIRPTDIASRYDGDNFAIILSETSPTGAKETAERLITAISDNPINIGDGKLLNIQINIGVATYPRDADIDSALFALATQALERAKLNSEDICTVDRKAKIHGL